MPEREKVVEGLRHCTAWAGLHECQSKIGPDCPYDNEADCKLALMRDALALLKKQEAVEPIPFFTETGAEVQNYVICGHCKSINAIMPKYTKQKYCHECGFPVVWGGR